MKVNYFFLLILFIFSIKIGSAQTVIDLVDCQTECFWSTGDDEIKKWEFDALGNISDEVVLNYTCQSLAIGHARISSDTILNTFICTQYNNGGETRFWDGVDWELLGVTSTSFVVGTGGFENHFYMRSNSFFENRLHYFDGVSNSIVDGDTNAASADIAVDVLGRAWYSSRNEEGMLDSLHVISSTGENENSYPFNTAFNLTGLYGITIVNGIIYLGVNESSEHFPSSILKITIEDDVAKINEMNFDLSAFSGVLSDLASKYPGNPLDVINSIDRRGKDNSVFIYPNPTNDLINVDGENLLNQKIQIFSFDGVLQKEYLIDSTPFNFSLKELNSGVYILKCMNNTLKISKI